MWRLPHDQWDARNEKQIPSSSSYHRCTHYPCLRNYSSLIQPHHFGGEKTHHQSDIKRSWNLSHWGPGVRYFADRFSLHYIIYISYKVTCYGGIALSTCEGSGKLARRDNAPQFSPLFWEPCMSCRQRCDRKHAICPGMMFDGWRRHFMLRVACFGLSWAEVFQSASHLLGQDTHCKRAVEPDFQLALHPKADVSVGHRDDSSYRDVRWQNNWNVCI